MKKLINPFIVILFFTNCINNKPELKLPANQEIEYINSSESKKIITRFLKLLLLII